MLAIMSVAVGVALLTFGADLLVRGATTLALRLGISPLVIGLTVVALGTSLPEVAVSANAAVAGQGSVALGNVIGSNIFNVLIVLGVAALVRPLVVDRQLIRFDVPVMIAASALVPIVAYDQLIGMADGFALAALGGLYAGVLFVLVKRPGARWGHDPVGGKGGTLRNLVLVAAGAALLVVGARLLVSGATAIATALGATQLVIGLTVVAAGTSLPELATSLAALRRGQRELAVGNVIGSNVFNVFFVLGLAGVLAPDGIPVPSGVMTFDLPIMIGATLACLPIFFTGWSVSRAEGAVFVLFYVAYVTYLFFHLSNHAAEHAIRSAILYFAGPLTLTTLVLSAGREWSAKRRSDPAA